MTYSLDPMAALWVLLGLVLGLLIGSLTWGRAARRHARAADSLANAANAAAARTEAEHSARALAASEAAMRPLADEVDRLKRELTKAQRPVQAPLPLTQPLAEPLAGTGPLVAAAVPEVRQLKGVGDKFAAALAAIGLTTVDRIARLNADEAVDADGRLGVFNGRIAKDRLVEQAVLLDEGRMTEYATRFGQIGTTL